MLFNYIKSSFRNLVRYKAYSLINILGLTVGLTTSIFIFLWVKDEMSFDRFHSNADRIYQVWINNTFSDGRIDSYRATPAKLKEAIQNEVPDVESVAQLSMDTRLLVKFESEGFNEVGVYGDASLFEIFNFPIIAGDASKPLTGLKSIAISERLAKKLFKNEMAIGKSVTLGQMHELTVASVFADIPRNSTLSFDFVAPFELFTKENPWTNNWRSGGTRTIVMLKSSGLEGSANKRIAKLITSNCPDCTTSAFLYPFEKSRLYGEFENGINVGGRIEQVYLFGVVAALILVMACINFMNLSTARAASRSREVGVRKSLGSQRSGLAVQFIGESMMLSFVALFFAVSVVQLLLPFFNSITTKSIQLDVADPIFIAGVLTITLVSGMLAGSYPAIVLSGFDPVHVLKGDTQRQFGGNTLRKTLVVAQFTASMILVIGSIAVYKQILYISERNLGFDKDNIVVVNQNEGIVKNYAAIKNDLLQQPAIKSIAFGGNNIFTVPITTTDPVWSGKDDNAALSFKIFRCDTDFIPTLSIKILRGRNFSGLQDVSNYIINRKAAEVMGFDLDDAVGKELGMWQGEGRIIGVTEDFHNDNLKFGIEPMIFMYSESQGMHYYIKTDKNSSVSASIATISKVFQKHNPDYPFEYAFLDDMFDQEYRVEATVGKLSLSFTVIAILISCLGLFGLASFTAERRTKELGIRKVLGASSADLMIMLCNDFVVLLTVSLIIGCPIAWYLTSQYLSGYAYHVEINWITYALASLGMLLIAFFSVGYQSVRAALLNPVDSLRSE